MKMFLRRDPVLKPEAAKERIKRISNADYPSLLSWFDNSVMGLGQSFDRWRFHGDPIEEVERHLDALQALFDEIKERKKN
jgi:hypothetical protein